MRLLGSLSTESGKVDSTGIDRVALSNWVDDGLHLSEDQDKLNIKPLTRFDSFSCGYFLHIFRPFFRKF